ncbi:MAG: Crp/Fnr family transcriptional regulator [Leptolyngbyaceae cyanobacterium SM2_5_2]|nr:Crp/Fnr family transcriptional regulator [Leptolyngbyaceae cyanobacterium SM2_5_2]
MLTLSSRPQLSILQTFPMKASLPPLLDRLWLIEQGLVRTLTWNRQGDVVTLGIWGRGEVVGLPLTQLKPYQMECLTPVVVTELPLGRQSRYGQDLLLNHLWRGEELFAIVQTSSLAEALMSLLYWLAKRFGQPTNQGLLLEPVLTHQQLAETLGCSRVAVTRMLSQLERDGRLRRLKDQEKPLRARLTQPLKLNPQRAGFRRAILLPDESDVTGPTLKAKG